MADSSGYDLDPSMGTLRDLVAEFNEEGWEKAWYATLS